MSPRDLLRIDALVVICTALAACKSPPASENNKPAPAPSASASSALRGPSHGLQPDPEFSAELEATAAKCTYLAAKDIVSCATTTLEPLQKKIQSLGPVALETLLATVFDGAPPVANLAGPQMRTAYERSLGPSLEQAPIPPRVISALIDALGELPATMALRVAPAATFAATREGRLDAISQILERRPELRSTILPRLMRYSRLRALPEVQKWAASKDEKTALDAVEALRLMEPWTDEERTQVAPWLTTLLTHESHKVRGRAAAFLLECGNEPAAKALAWFEATIRDKQLTRDTILAFGRHCRIDDPAEQTADKLAKLASTPTCSKIENALDRIAADEKTDGNLREGALQALTASWPQRALARAKTLTNHSDTHLAQIARNVITLTDKHKGKDAGK